jgi:hypothetical protein
MADVERRTESPADAAIEEQQFGRVLSVLGWTLIIFDCVVGVWIWVGFRSGSFFWLYWVVGTGAVAVVLLWYGAHKQARETKDFNKSTPQH